MKYAIISDVHANLEALTAVLERAEDLGCDAYVCLGDLVGYGASPNACVERVRDLTLAAVVKGNHDDSGTADYPLIGYCPQAAHSVQWTRDTLTAENASWLRHLPLVQRHADFLAVHASPHRPDHWEYVFDAEAADSAFAAMDFDLCFVGHSHVPMAFELTVDGLFAYGKECGRRKAERSQASASALERFFAWGRALVGETAESVGPGWDGRLAIEPGNRYLINVGSVGQPRDGDSRASFATLDVENGDCVLHRVEYEVDEAQRRILEAGLPERMAIRLERGQ